MSEVGNEDAGGVLARLMRGANLRRSVEVLKAPDESLAATVSALANTAGGWILIGPDPEDGWRSAVGFDAEAAVEALRGALGAVEPEVRAEAGIASVDGRPVAWLRVHEVDRRRRPARVQGAGRAGAFLRTDEGTRPLTAYERYRMMEERCPPLFDIEPVEHANPDELEAERIAAMLGFARERHPNVFARLSDETALMQLGVLTRVDGRICPTLGGLVAGSIFPQKHFPRLVLEVSVLEGPRGDGADEGRRVLFMKPVPGPAAEMAAEAERIVMASWAPAAETTDGAFARALRAALVNALEHRDYSPEGRGMPVRVRVFEDAVDIRSPGGLFGMAPEALASDAGLRASRNERLARMLSLTPLAGGLAAEGTGFGCAAILGCGADGLAVRVETTPAAFTVIFAKAAEEEKADIREEVRAEAPDESAAPLAGADQADFETILRERLAEAGSLSVKEITLLAGVSRQTAAKRVKRLVEAGVIEPTEARQNPRQRYRLAAKGRRAKRGRGRSKDCSALVSGLLEGREGGGRMNGRTKVPDSTAEQQPAKGQRKDMRRKNKKIDMLNGSIWDKMIVFALPLAFTGMLQQLFNAADVAVLGRFVSNESMAGVGNNVPVIGLIIALCMGLALGANVVVARLLGMKEPERANRAVHTALATAVIFGIGAAIVGECFAGPAMDWLSVPEAVRDDALTYLRVYLLGMPFIAIYNFLAAVMRSQGDTQTPLWALVAATLVNIAGNLFFVLAFGMGTAGVALATVLANALAASLLFFSLITAEGPLHIEPREVFRIDMTALRPMVRIGWPAGLQGAVFSISNLVIQSAINSLGADAMAGSVAAFTIEINIYCFINAFGLAATTFVSQNYGAKNLERCKRATYVATGLNMVATVLMVALVLVFGRTMLGLFTDVPAVVELAMARIFWVASFEPISVLMEVSSSAMRGYGYSMPPAMATLICVCSVRLIWVWTVFAASPDYVTLMIVYPISWAVTVVPLLYLYVRLMKRIKRRFEERAFEAEAA